MKVAISAINWEEKLEGKNGLERWEIVKNIIQEETDKCVPGEQTQDQQEHYQEERVKQKTMRASRHIRMSRSKYRRVSGWPEGSWRES